MTNKTHRLTEIISIILETETPGPVEAIGVIGEVIGTIAMKDPDMKFPKTSEVTLLLNGEKFLVETKVSRVTN